MQGIVLKVIVGLIAAAVLLVGLLAVALPRLIDSDEFHTTLHERAAETFGSPVEWQSLEARLLPPRLTVSAPVLVAATGNSEDAHLKAESVDLRLALFPIFAGRVEVDSLVLHGVELVVTRTSAGFLLPIGEGAQEEKDSEAKKPGDPLVTDENRDEESFDLTLRRVVISDSRIIIRDQTLPTPIEWRFEDLRFEAKGGAIDEPLAIELAATLQVGATEVGKIQTVGTVGLNGLYDLDVELEKLRLAEFQPYLSDATVAGMISGRVSLEGESSTLSEIDLDLRIDQLAVRSHGFDLVGGLTLRASRTLDDPAGFSSILDFESGGQAKISGVLTREGALDAKMKLDALDLSPLAHLAGPETQISGLATGEVELRVTADRELERLATKLRISSARLISDAVDVSGNFDLVASLEGKGPAQLEAGLDLSDGGRVDIEGTSTREGALDVRATIESFDLAIVKPFLPEQVAELSGLATGKGRIVGETVSPDFIGLDVEVVSGLLRMSDYRVEGPFSAALKVKDPLSARPRGRVDLGLTAARLEYRNQFEKPAGMRAEMTTKFTTEASGEILFESRIKFRDINEILLQGGIGDTTSVALTTSDIDLEQWSDVLPVLEPYRLDGIITFEDVGIELFEDSPSRFGGHIELGNVSFRMPAAGRLQIQGTIMGEGTRIRTKGLRVFVGGTTIGIVGKVEDPLNEARFQVAAKSIGVSEVNDLLSALSSNRDTVFGNLEFAGELRGIASSEADLYSSLEGEFEFSIGEGKGGRLRGVSILRTILDQFPLLGGAATLTQAFRGGRSVDDYFTEDFEIIEGKFEVGHGKVHARTLRIVYEGYEAKLSGPIRLRDLAIDMTGEVLLKEDLVAALGGHDDEDQVVREPIRIPLARVTNTLADPEIEMTAETLAAVPKLLFQATGLDTLAIGVGKALGRMLGGGDR